MLILKCPQCRAKVRIPSAPLMGTQIACSHCGRTLEVIWLYPVVLDVLDIDPARLEEGHPALTPKPADL